MTKPSIVKPSVEPCVRPSASPAVSPALRILVAIAALAVLGPALAQGDAAAGKQKSAVCAACHGADGNSTNPEWPKIAGQNTKYLEKQLLDLKNNDERSNAVMLGMVAGLSEQDRKDLAAYYAGQTQTGGVADAGEQVVNLGQSLYRGGNQETGVPACTSCHGPTGQGNPLGGIPAIAGQHAPYTAAQLHAFRSEARWNDSQGMMRSAVRFLSDGEIKALASYLSGLH